MTIPARVAMRGLRGCVRCIRGQMFEEPAPGSQIRRWVCLMCGNREETAPPAPPRLVIDDLRKRGRPRKVRT